jgi:serine/threonine protein kinase
LTATLPGTGGKALVPGDRLGRYQLIKRLAVGGMAEIFLARSQGIDGFEKLVVCKCILAERAGDQSWVDAFLDEARLAATLAHPNIAQVFDVGRERDLHFFTMEYVHGADLREVQAAAKGALPLEIAVAIVVGVAAGLHYAHEQCDSTGRPLNIVHRDVSPSNVLISYDGAVKVVDFGIAKAAVRRAATRTGTIKGKAGYMSPEQCRGEALDRRSDLFAIGILLYQLTTGVVPFDEENEYAIIRRVVDEDVPPPSTVRPDYPQALEAIVLRALRRSREERYATAQEIQVDLETFARDSGFTLSTVDVARYMEEIFGDRRQQHLEALAALVGSENVQQLSTTFVRPTPTTGVRGRSLSDSRSPRWR